MSSSVWLDVVVVVLALAAAPNRRGEGAVANGPGSI